MVKTVGFVYYIINGEKNQEIKGVKILNVYKSFNFKKFS
jgi:hypothetical protein